MTRTEVLQEQNRQAEADGLAIRFEVEKVREHKEQQAALRTAIAVFNLLGVLARWGFKSSDA